MAAVRANIKRELLTWARESAGFSMEEAAKKAQVTPERLEAWESSDQQPTLNQLNKLANAYKQPISAFYLTKAPKVFEPPHDFRRLPGEVALTYSPKLKTQLQALYRRRQVALDLLEDIGEDPRRFAWRARLNDDPESVGERIREILGVTYTEQVTWRQPQKSYGNWRRKIEALGVLVFQLEGVATDQMRGVSVAENILPVIAINVKDKPNGRAFTLLHEFMHLMLHRSGTCDLTEDSLRPAEDDRVEVFCNKIAAVALIPRDRLLAEPLVAGKGAKVSTWENDELDALSRQFGGASMEAVLRRLVTVGRASETFYRQKRREFLAMYRAAEKQHEGEFYRSLPREAVYNYGRPFVRLVLENYYQDRIPLSDVAKLLSIRAGQLARVEELIGR